MHPFARNGIAIIGGLIVGSMVNMGIIMISADVIAPPPGADLTSREGLIASMHLMSPQHFLMPFLAHALGTLAGAIVAARIAITHRMTFAMAIGCVFLLGGIASVFILPSPLWFTVVDLGLAYLPMAFIAGRLMTKRV